MEELKLQTQEVHLFSSFVACSSSVCLATFSMVYTLFLGIGRKGTNLQNL
jgi:hypothetical protein